MNLSKSNQPPSPLVSRHLRLHPHAFHSYSHITDISTQIDMPHAKQAYRRFLPTLPQLASLPVSIHPLLHEEVVRSRVAHHTHSDYLLLQHTSLTTTSAAHSSLSTNFLPYTSPLPPLAYFDISLSTSSSCSLDISHTHHHNPVPASPPHRAVAKFSRLHQIQSPFARKSRLPPWTPPTTTPFPKTRFFQT